MEYAIELRNVSKSFGRFRAVDGISLQVPRGTMFGLLGPNGAGKTTTIRMIMNITAPDSGEIQILGRPMDRQMQNRIGYLPEERGLYRKMKVIDHLYFLAAIKEVSRDAAKERISAWLDKMELGPWLNKKVDELSKGMQQKIQFIATIVHDPDILILDEPFSGLDPINVALMREYFLDFRARGKTIVFCTHVLEQAEKLCDEICLMARSKKILEGSLKELKRRNSEGLIRTGRERLARRGRRAAGRGYREGRERRLRDQPAAGSGPARVPEKGARQVADRSVLTAGTGLGGDLPRSRQERRAGRDPHHRMRRA